MVEVTNGYDIGAFANLEGANLKGAYLEGANLEGAYLRDADLRDADLRGANLRGANLRDADLRGANLRDADLRGACLEGAYLRDADLRGAYLEGANLEGAYLRDADLRDADLRGAYLPNFLICPQEGSFVAYKKTTRGVIKVLIPKDAQRTNSLTGRKCRTDKVVVMGGEGVGGTGPNYPCIIYNEGDTIVCPDYDPDIRVECTKGIHFFMTEKEAREW